MEQSNTNKSFSDLQGLIKLPEEESNQSSSSDLSGSTNETVYQVQDKLYGTDIVQWKGCIFEIGDKMFPDGEGYFYYKDGEKIEKEMMSFKVGNYFYTGECENGKPHGQGEATYSNGDSLKENGKMASNTVREHSPI